MLWTLNSPPCKGFLKAFSMSSVSKPFSLIRNALSQRPVSLKDVTVELTEEEWLPRALHRGPCTEMSWWRTTATSSQWVGRPYCVAPPRLQFSLFSCSWMLLYHLSHPVVLLQLALWGPMCLFCIVCNFSLGASCEFFIVEWCILGTLEYFGAFSGIKLFGISWVLYKYAFKLFSVGFKALSKFSN